ncbi:thermonuclease family protein [Aureimonas psammosilenae]|uniref:thermonuclease family protein n=1 Tax=Aureimonas psammosilenae TaxID=2495496 RepID=UPI0012606774|nr:thermonuclease family protein [Aureimonas psammosilenae]
MRGNLEALGAFRERLQGTAATALALLVLALLFAFLVPMRGEIAEAMNAGRRETAARIAAAPAGETTVAPEAEPAPAAAPETPAPAPSAEPIAPEPTLQASLDPAPEGALRLLARPVALDTGTILVGRGKVRLVGIEPISMSRRCEGVDGAWFCGVEARTQFRAFLRARSISCAVPEGFGSRTEEIAATCSLAGEDLGRWLVSNGWATAAPDGPYAANETEAKTRKAGVWSERRFGG